MSESNNLSPKRIALANKLKILLAIIIGIVTVICTIVIFASPKEEEKFEYEDKPLTMTQKMEAWTKTCLKEYVLYPETFELKKINFSSADYDTYEMWYMDGYFTAESKIGLTVRSDYEVTIRYNVTTDTAYKYKIVIDGETVF